MEKAGDVIIKRHIFRLFCLVLSLLIFILPGVSCLAANELPDGVSIIETQKFSLLDALYRAQGVTTDGSYLYFSSNQFVASFSNITKTTMDGTVKKANLNAIPFKAKLDLGIHIGGIDYSDGFIYGSVEDNTKVNGVDYNHPYLTIYDASDMSLVRYLELPLALRVLSDNGDGIISADEVECIYSKSQVNEPAGDIWLHRDGIPWVAVDNERGYIYSAEWSHAKYINVFDLETLEFVKLIEVVDESGNPYSYLDEINGGPHSGLHRVQGADVYGGKLYCSSDIGEVQPVLVVDFDKIEGKGVVSCLFTRNLGDRECEDGAIYDDGNNVFYVTQFIDGLSIYVRFYDISSIVEPEAPSGALTINRSYLQIGANESVQLVAKSSAAGIRWSSSDENVVKVDAYGKVTPVAPGKAVIFASDNIDEVRCEVRVNSVFVQWLIDTFLYWGLAA